MTSNAKKGGAAAIAAGIVDGRGERSLASYVEAMSDEHETTATQAARVVDDVVKQQPQLGAPHIGRFVAMLRADNARAVQTSAHALPELARVAPAKVAKHLATLRESYDTASDAGREGIVHTFVALCTASVAYQRRVIDVLERALGEAEPKTLVRFSEVVLPALKGEPHAMARAVVEQRLPELPRPEGTKIADMLGVKLRIR